MKSKHWTMLMACGVVANASWGFLGVPMLRPWSWLTAVFCAFVCGLWAGNWIKERQERAR